MNPPRFLLLLAVVLIPSFGHSEEPSRKDEHLVDVVAGLKPYPALFAVDRTEMGFPPLPKTGKVRIMMQVPELQPMNRPLPDGDLTFQFFETPDRHDFHRTERDVTLRKVEGTLQWQSEQMTFYGPKTFLDDEELQQPEMIVIRHEVVGIEAPKKKTVASEIFYEGSDKRLGGNGDAVVPITLDQAGPILREWGYSYDADLTRKSKAQPRVPAEKKDSK